MNLRNSRTKFASNQIFHFIRCITPKLVTSYRTHISVIALALNTAPFKEMLQQWRAVGNNMPDLTGPRFDLRPLATETIALSLERLADFGSRSYLKYFIITVDVKLRNRINAPSIFYSVNFDVVFSLK